MAGLKTVKPISDQFHIHKFKDTPSTWVKETSLFRSNTYSVILMKSGKAEYKIGLSDYQINGPCIYFQSPLHLRYYNRLSDWDGYVIVFTDDFIAKHIPLKNRVMEFSGFKIDSRVLVSLEEAEFMRLERLHNILYDEAYNNSSIRFEICKGLLEVIINVSQEYYNSLYRENISGKHNRIVRQFDQILESYMYEITTNRRDQPLTVAEVAAKIFLNPNYLGEVVKKQTGKSPKSIIIERVLLEARSMLHNTELSISDIAYILLFKDTSYFTRLFKSKVGLLPNQFRKNR